MVGGSHSQAETNPISGRHHRGQIRGQQADQI